MTSRLSSRIKESSVQDEAEARYGWFIMRTSVSIGMQGWRHIRRRERDYGMDESKQDALPSPCTERVDEVIFCSLEISGQKNKPSQAQARITVA